MIKLSDFNNVDVISDVNSFDDLVGLIEEQNNRIKMRDETGQVKISLIDDGSDKILYQEIVNFPFNGYGDAILEKVEEHLPSNEKKGIFSLLKKKKKIKDNSSKIEKEEAASDSLSNDLDDFWNSRKASIEKKQQENEKKESHSDSEDESELFSDVKGKRRLEETENESIADLTFMDGLSQRLSVLEKEKHSIEQVLSILKGIKRSSV